MTVTGCKKRSDAKGDESDILVSVNDSSLYLGHVLSQIPVGISPEDSIEMFHSIVDTWVRNMVLNDIGRNNIPDMSRIDAMVESYRNELIVEQYLTLMGEKAPQVSDDQIRKYYESHKEELILESPLIKGIFLKVSDKDDFLPALRRWMADSSEESIDRIEQHGLKQASQYEYFKDTWHEWQSIADQIPYRFYDADAFVSGDKDFETSYGGSTYMLHISEYLPSGSPMPYEYATQRITEILRNQMLNQYREHLISDIYGNSIRSGVLKPGLYDPVTKKMKSLRSDK